MDTLLEIYGVRGRFCPLDLFDAGRFLTPGVAGALPIGSPNHDAGVGV